MRKKRVISRGTQCHKTAATMSAWMFLALFSLPTLCYGDNCSFDQKIQLKEQHKQCTNTVQQRYSIMTVVPDESSEIISTPLAYKTGPNAGLSQKHVCAMIEETVKQCAQIYAHCFNDLEMR